MQIPHDQLSPETLTALIEEFITRHGAVHGHDEMSLETQVAQVRRQLRRGEIAILWDEETESCTLAPTRGG